MNYHAPHDVFHCICSNSGSASIWWILAGLINDHWMTIAPSFSHQRLLLSTLLASSPAVSLFFSRCTLISILRLKRDKAPVCPQVNHVNHGQPWSTMVNHGQPWSKVKTCCMWLSQMHLMCHDVSIILTASWDGRTTLIILRCDPKMSKAIVQWRLASASFSSRTRSSSSRARLRSWKLLCPLECGVICQVC